MRVLRAMRQLQVQKQQLDINNFQVRITQQERLLIWTAKKVNNRISVKGWSTYKVTFMVPSSINGHNFDSFLREGHNQIHRKKTCKSTNLVCSMYMQNITSSTERLFCIRMGMRAPKYFWKQPSHK